MQEHQKAQRKKEAPAAPSQTLLVKAAGKTYADLLKQVRDEVTQEEAGEVLFVRRIGGDDTVQIRAKAGPKAEALPGVIRSKVEGAVVRTGVRYRSLSFST